VALDQPPQDERRRNERRRPENRPSRAGGPRVEPRAREHREYDRHLDGKLEDARGVFEVFLVVGARTHARPVEAARSRAKTRPWMKKLTVCRAA
jgi:hypothetical protein